MAICQPVQLVQLAPQHTSSSDQGFAAGMLTPAIACCMPACPARLFVIGNSLKAWAALCKLLQTGVTACSSFWGSSGVLWPSACCFGKQDALHLSCMYVYIRYIPSQWLHLIIPGKAAWQLSYSSNAHMQ